VTPWSAGRGFAAVELERVVQQWIRRKIGRGEIAIHPGGPLARTFNPGGDFPQGGMLWLDPGEAEKLRRLGVDHRILHDLEISGADLERLGCKMLKLPKVEVVEPPVPAPPPPVVLPETLIAAKRRTPGPKTGKQLAAVAAMQDAIDSGRETVESLIKIKRAALSAAFPDCGAETTLFEAQAVFRKRYRNSQN
jgi:hypothetical protein